MNKLFAELQRRNVFRVAGVYAVVGWLLIQIAVAVLPTFGAPQWIAQTFIALIFLGFPIALIFAWAFEMTPEGMKRTSAVPEGESITGKTGKRLDMILAGTAALLVIVIIGDRLIPHGDTGRRSTGAHEDFSIAVLPFSDMSPEGDQEYFADGISEELLNVLAQVPGLEVAGRTSSFAFKGQNTDLREIGRILDVAHVLEGSVRKSGNRVRVTAQLIRADNGFHMWSDTYDGDLTDIFAVQDEIANAILAELKPQLMGTVAPAAAPRTDITAYDFYLLAQQKAALNTMAGFQAAAEALDKALEIDPDFVPALAWRGYYELMMSDGNGAAGDIPAEVAFKRADEWISRALRLDRDSADALFARAGLLSMSFDAETRKQAEAFYKRALEKKPNFALARNDYGYWLSDQQRFDEAVAQFEIALEHDPAQSDVNSNLISHYSGLGDYTRARELVDRWSEISPQNPGPFAFRAEIESALGNLAEALKFRRRVLELAPDDPRASRDLHFTELQLGEFENGLKAKEPYIRYRAMMLMGRKQDALKLVASELAARPDFPTQQSDYLDLHNVVRDWKEVVRYYDATWDSLEAFQSPFRYPPYNIVLPALLDAKHPDAPAMLAAWRESIDSRRSEGFASGQMDAIEANLLLIEGDTDKGMDLAEAAYARGFRNITLFMSPYLNDPANPRGKAFLAKYSKDLNAERAKLGLQPIDPPKPYK